MGCRKKGIGLCNWFVECHYLGSFCACYLSDARTSCTEEDKRRALTIHMHACKLLLEISLIHIHVTNSVPERILIFSYNITKSASHNKKKKEHENTQAHKNGCIIPFIDVPQKSTQKNQKKTASRNRNRERPICTSLLYSLHKDINGRNKNKNSQQKTQTRPRARRIQPLSWVIKSQKPQNKIYSEQNQESPILESHFFFPSGLFIFRACMR